MKLLQSGVLLLIIGLLSGCLESSRQAPADIASKYADNAILYSTSWCGYCEKTRKLMDKNNIDYVEFDIEHSKEAKAEFDQLGGRGIPLVLIDGRVVEGYAPKAVLELAKGIN